MSAIFGIFHKNGLLNKSEAENMRNSFTHVKFDDEGKWLNRNIFFGCLHQQLTPESELEKIPYVTFKSNVIINADVILYNRKELIDKLELKTEQDSLTDVFLLSAAYHRWGYSCPEYLNGDFSFVIFDKKTQKLFCCRSHTGTRTFYYFNSSEVFAFSSLMRPLFRLKDLSLKLNDSYIADFLYYSGVNHDFDPMTTIYKNILQLEPASCMLIEKNKVKKWQYWAIKKRKETVFKKESDYEEAFEEVLNKSVQRRLRSKKEIGILLSGGFDSGVVSMFAAKNLFEKNKKLLSYTHIPIKGFNYSASEKYIIDESYIVKGYQKLYKNLIVNLNDAEGKNAYNGIDRFIDIFEQPYKMFRNAYWIHECQQSAMKDGVRILLTGQFGNTTISWGNFFPYILSLFKRLKMSMMFKEIKKYSELNDMNRRNIYLKLIFTFLPLTIKKQIKSLRDLKAPNIAKEFMNKEFCSMMDVESHFQNSGVDTHLLNIKQYIDQRVNSLSPHILTHMGSILTKNGLNSNIHITDPTCDKNVIEFCLNLPENQYVRDGITRRLIKNFIINSNKFPSELTSNLNARGRQAADWYYRLKNNWVFVIKDLRDIGSYEIERKYLDITSIQNSVDQIQTYNFKNNNNTNRIRYLFRILIFSRFLRKTLDKKA